MGAARKVGVRAAPRLTNSQLKLLRQYEHTSDSSFMQALPGASELWRPLGLLAFRGHQYGCAFYSITEKGREALASVAA